MEEMLLGPVSPELSPLFPVETRLKSLLYRNGVVYADFSEDAVFPPVEGGNILGNFRTLHTGILRNFSYVKDVRFFIEGNPVYVEEFKYGAI
jgi:spore germination protein GerM